MNKTLYIALAAMVFASCNNSSTESEESYDPLSIEEVAAAPPAEPAVNPNQQYLIDNKKKAGVITTASGLQYEVLTEGSGEKPTINSTVTTHYHGMLVDGSVFDSSVERGEPIQFGVTGVIAGWTEALQLMPVGSKWRLTIPSEMAYGSMGRPGIPPNSTLIFDVELISIDN